MTLKTLEDGRRIKAMIAAKKVKKVVILGMGYIALEMCEALRALDLEVAMVKPGPRFLPWLQEELADRVREEVTTRGVAVHAGHRVERIETVGDGLRVVCEGLTLESDMVLVGIGVTPNNDLAGAAGIALGVNGSVAVDRRLQTSDSRYLRSRRLRRCLPRCDGAKDLDSAGLARQPGRLGRRGQRLRAGCGAAGRGRDRRFPSVRDGGGPDGSHAAGG